MNILKMISCKIRVHLLVQFTLKVIGKQKKEMITWLELHQKQFKFLILKVNLLNVTLILVLKI